MLRFAKSRLSSSRRGFSSIFDVIRERRLEQAQKSEQVSSPPTPLNASSSIPQPPSTELTLDQICKQYSILRSKPRGYRNHWMLRYLGVHTLQLLPIASAEELCKIVEILAYVKHRSVVLLQGISEALYWHCKLNKCKLQQLTSYLRSCATLKFVPSYRYLELFLAQVDNVHNKPLVCDYLRILQFLVENQLSTGDIFMDLYERCYNHCLNNMGYMNHHHLSSFSQTQLLIDKCDWGVFDRICRNFERDIHESHIDHFLMLSNALMRSDMQRIPLCYSNIVGHYLAFPEKWNPRLVNTVLRLLEKFYHRDTVLLSKIGDIIVKNIGSFSHQQTHVSLNHYAALSYKHKELIHGVLKSHLCESGDIPSKLQVLAGVSNLLAKVEYKHVGAFHSITDRAIAVLKALNGDMQIATSDEQPVMRDPLVDGKLPWIAYDYRGRKSGNSYRGSESPQMVVTGKMMLETLGPPKTVENRKEIKHRPTVRRLIYKSHQDHTCYQTPTSDLSKLKVTPVSVDIMRRQSLNEALQHFYNEYFEGRHPASRRLEIRSMMRKQHQQLLLRKGFKPSKVLPAVRLEKNNTLRINKSIRKVKKKMRYSGSRYVQSTQHYINECRVLKRCFLRPYKHVLNTHDVTTRTVELSVIEEKTKEQQLASMWKKFSHLFLSRSAMYGYSINTTSPLDVESTPNDELMDKLEQDSEVIFISGNVEKERFSLPQDLMQRQHLMENLDSFVDDSSPVFIDDALIMEPVAVSSLFSWRLKRKLHFLQRIHSNNKMQDTMSYMLSNGIWNLHQASNELHCLPREQPIWRYTFDIVSSLHKLKFTSFELLDQMTKAFRKAEPLAIAVEHDHIQEGSGEVILKTVRRLGYMVSALSPILSGDASRVLNRRLLSLVCSSNILRFLERETVNGNMRMELSDVVQVFRMLNIMVFLQYQKVGARHEDSNKKDDNGCGPVKIADIMESYRSLHALALHVKSDLIGGVNILSGGASKRISDMIKLVNEVVYSNWISSCLIKGQQSLESAEFYGAMEANVDVMQQMLNQLQVCIEECSEKDTILHGICAVRRYIMLLGDKRFGMPVKEISQKSNNEYEDDTLTMPLLLRIQRIMKLHKVTEDDIDKAICMPYGWKEMSLSLGGRVRASVVNDDISIKRASNQQTVAGSVLHNFYFNHYQVV